MQRQGLYRSRRDRVFGGVAGGIARSLNADPAIVRLIFAILIIVGGGGLLLYLILWIAIPEEPIDYFQAAAGNADQGTTSETGNMETSYQPPAYTQRKNNGALIAGLVFIVIGALFLIDKLFPDIYFNVRDFWPIVFVIAGLALIFSSFSGTKKNINP